MARLSPQPTTTGTPSRGPAAQPGAVGGPLDRIPLGARAHGAPVTVWLAALVYTVVLSLESVAAHRSFVTGVDTALYDQLLWLLANGHEPFSTIFAKSLLADHFQPGLVLLTPFAWLGGVPVLLVVQSAALASTGPALYALARAGGAKPWLAAVPALLWIACPFVARLNLWEFRPTAFASVLVVLSVLGAVQRRPWLLALSALGALSLKEDVALVYVVLGAILAIRGERRLGGFVAAAATAWYAVAVLVLRSSGDSLDAFGRRFAGERGDSVWEALAWMALHPLETASHVVTEGLPYLLALFLGTGGLALLAPLWMLLALPNALHNALSAYEPQHLLSFHYHQLTMHGLFVAAALGVARLHSAGRALRSAATAGVAAAALLAVGAGSWAHAHWTEGIRLPREPTSSVLRLVPPDAAVAATPHLLPQVSRRVDVYMLPSPFVRLDIGTSLTDAELAERAQRIEYVLFRENDLPVEYTGTDEDVLELLAAEGFDQVGRAGPVTVYARAPGP